MIDAIRYLVGNGVKWRNLPADFPPWKRVYAFFRRWRDNGLIRDFHDRLRDRARKAEGRSAEPTAAIADSQSVKADAVVKNDSRGFDGGKKIKPRKRHVIVDCLGLLLMVLVTPASTPDRDAAQEMLPTLREGLRRLRLLWADSGYTGPLVDWAARELDLTVEVVKRSPSTRARAAFSRLSSTARIDGTRDLHALSNESDVPSLPGQRESHD
ncbi:IS5 family transposase [Streptomyces capitiformicae]|uniref:Transposase n=1 Tax=Streptomyces capitiformicae TaxID=2014920 RepID=A0A919GAY8_9ACTN|nr:IS5 family transposase [Streptomyces capitiformicae]GHH81079.1 hypothetical protein GCM10017771_01990 [Streptomyces capitiformicae]